MKRIFKICIFALLSIMLLSVSVPAFADVIVEPWEDDFYNEHKDECVYNNNRMYIVNTDKGYAYLYVSPKSSVSIKGYSNGDQVSISWLYTDASGEEWGVLSYGSGWFRMSDLTLIYDSYEFIADHGDEMEDYISGSYSIPTSDEKPVVMWKYPGCKTEYFFDYGEDVADHVGQIYRDADGVEWGHISYYYGSRSVWVCLSDPYADRADDMKESESLKAEPVESEEIPALSADKSEMAENEEKQTVTVNGESIELKAEPVPRDEIPMNDGNFKTLAIVGALVLGVAAITAAAIIIFARRNAKKQEDSEGNEL